MKKLVRISSLIAGGAAAPIPSRSASTRAPKWKLRLVAASSGSRPAASENAVRTCLDAIQALGGAGYTKEWPVERLLRDAKLYDIGAGTNEIRRFLIGRELVAGG